MLDVSREMAAELLLCLPTGSLPPVVRTESGRRFVLKLLGGWRRRERAAANVWVVAGMGQLLGAPVAPFALVNVPDGVLGDRGSSMLSHVAFGSEWQEDFMLIRKGSYWSLDEYWELVRLRENSAPLALLSVLWAWFAAVDTQVMASREGEILSIDHEFILAGLLRWGQPQGLKHRARAKLDKALIEGARVRRADVDKALGRLSAITDEDIRGVLASVPEEWSIEAEEADSMLDFLTRRRIELLENPFALSERVI